MIMMRDYWICPICSTALDHGEKCDCRDRNPVAYCFTCSRPLFAEDALHDADPAYDIDGHVICEECVDKYVKENCKAELPFVKS